MGQINSSPLYFLPTKNYQRAKNISLGAMVGIFVFFIGAMILSNAFPGAGKVNWSDVVYYIIFLYLMAKMLAGAAVRHYAQVTNEEFIYKDIIGGRRIPWKEVTKVYTTDSTKVMVRNGLMTRANIVYLVFERKEYKPIKIPISHLVDSQILASLAQKIVNEKQTPSEAIAQAKQSVSQNTKPHSAWYKWFLYLLIFGVIFMLPRAFAEPPRQIQYDDMGYIIETQ